LVRTHAIGLNFADVYRRQGRYHLAGQPPYVAGYEAAGVVVDAGGSPHFRVGDRVGFADSPFANAELVAVDDAKLIPLPPDIACDQAAAVLLQGLTAQYLTRDSHPLRAGETVLVHAAAGGVGLLLTQIARACGARVLGLTSSQPKAAMARDAGAEAVVLYADDWKAAARAFSTAGAGIDVVYDSVGSTLLDSLAVTRTGGRVVFYGMAGGAPPAIAPQQLMDESKTLTGGDLWNVLRTRDDRVARAGELFSWLRRGSLKVRVAARVALADGARAHALLESRNTSGKVLLLP
jgi:NADPH2:quinone reductase